MGLRAVICALLVAAVVPVGGQAAVSVGAYGNTVRFDRLTGQRTESGLVFLGWDQGRTWGSPYRFFLDLGLAQVIVDSGKPSIVRPLVEMNNSKNPSCAITPAGGRRGAAYSTRWYRKAFERIYVLLHGGTAQQLSSRLQALGMPGVGTDVPLAR